MSVADQPGRAGLIARVQGILLHPKTEWDVIAAEQTTVQQIFLGYACILAAIPAIAGFIGWQVFGLSMLGFSWHPSLLSNLAEHVVGYVLSLVMVFLLALVIDALAPNFGGEKNQIQSVKVAAYSYTAGWVVGIVLLVPALGIISILGLYSLYLLYVGLPKLMKVPQEKATGYFITTLIVAIVLAIVVFAVGSIFTRMGMGHPGGGPFPSAQNGGTVRFNGGSVDLGKLQAAAAAADVAAKQSANGKVAAIDPQKLATFLPASVAGIPRTELSSASGGAGGVSSSTAEAVYSKDSARITLKVVDMAAAGAFAGLAGAMNVQSSRQTATGYQKTTTVNGQLTTESWDNQSKSGQFSVVVANRFMVEADGSANSIDDLKSAVAAVGPDRLAGLAKA